MNTRLLHIDDTHDVKHNKKGEASAQFSQVAGQEDKLFDTRAQAKKSLEMSKQEALKGHCGERTASR